MSLAQRLLALELETLQLEVNEAVLTVTIHRPGVLNALSPTVIAELREVFGSLRTELGQPDPSSPALADWSVRGVVLTGAGEKAFVAGADISVMREMTPAESREYAEHAQELTSWIETTPVPVVAAVNGYALGGGLEFAMACDYMFASENASFGQPEVALGLIPGFGGTVRLAQYVGIAAAREMILTGRRIDVAEALRLGLVLRVFSDTEALRHAAHENLLLVAKQSPTAVASAKLTTRAVRALSTDDGLTYEAGAFASRFGTPDMIEGTTAFVEKRQPAFIGQ